MATDDVLSITDGGTTLDLLRGPVRVGQDAWEPAIAAPRESDLGGRGLWDDVTETLPLQVIATPAQNPGATWGMLMRLLERSRRWARGDQSASPARLRVRPAGSRLPAGVMLEAAITGGGGGAMSALYPRLLEAGVSGLADVELRRRGVWLNPTAEAATIGSLAMHVPGTLTWPTNHPTESPLSLRLSLATGVASVANPRIAAGSRLLIGASAQAFTVLAAETLAGSTGFTSVASTRALGGAYLSLGGGSVGTKTSGVIAATAMSTGDVYIVASNPHSQDTPVTLLLSSSVAGDGYPRRLTTTIPAGATPTVIYVGRVAGSTLYNRVRIEYDPLSGVPERARIDSIVFHRDEGPITGALEWGADLYGGAYAYGLTGADLGVLALDHLPNTLPSPRTYQILNSGATDPMVNVTMYGDPALLSRGQNLGVLALICSPDEFVPQTTVGGGTPVSLFWAASRQPAYLVPE